MKIKRILAFLAGILVAVSAVWLTNQPEQVSASVFQKTTVPKKFRGTSHLLIKTKGNRMWICSPHGQTSAAYVINNRKKLYVFVITWPNTYYKSKSAARKNYKADSSMSRRDKLSKLV